MQFKKQAVDLTDLAIGIVVLGIVVSIGATILITARDARLTDLDIITTTNEKATSAADLTLTNTWGNSVINVTNATSGELIGAGNYSVSISSTNGIVTITNATQTPGGALPWNVTYNWYNTSRADWALPNNATTGIAEYGNWFKIIVIVGVAAVVLSLIFMAFGRGGGRIEGAGGSY